MDSYLVGTLILKVILSAAPKSRNMRLYLLQGLVDEYLPPQDIHCKYLIGSDFVTIGYKTYSKYQSYLVFCQLLFGMISIEKP